ncbi:MAG: dethiobiotin synthase, partial [Aeromicrobium sp.]
MRFPNSKYVIVTGTDTGVGKTVTTAALAVALEERGFRVAIVKPVQTGVEGDDAGDVDEIVRMTGITSVYEFVRLEAALAPESAAMLQLAELSTVAELADRLRMIDADAVLIEGAGGLLVRIDLDGGTLRDLAKTLRAEVIVVGREGLGALNHFALTVESLRGAIRHEPHVVIGSYASEPG